MSSAQFHQDDVEVPFPQHAFVDQGSLEGRGASWVNFGNDRSQLVIFYYAAILNPQRSREAGRPVHERKTFVRISQPGESRFQEIEREVVDSDKQRWPQQWRAFIEKRAYVPEGTPVDQLFPANPEIAGMLRGMGIHIVEHLAKLTPHAIDTLGMGAQDWVNKAKTYLESATKGVEHHVIETMRKDFEHRENALKNQIADLVSKINQMQAGMNSLPVGQQMAAQMAVAPAQDPRPLPVFNENAAPATGWIEEELEPVVPGSPILAPSPRRKGWPKGKPRKPAAEE